MRTGAFALLSLFLAAAALAQTAADDEFLNRLYETRTFSHVAISPDGKRVAWAVEGHGLTIANADGAVNTRNGQPEACRYVLRPLRP